MRVRRIERGEGAGAARGATVIVVFHGGPSSAEWVAALAARSTPVLLAGTVDHALETALEALPRDGEVLIPADPDARPEALCAPAHLAFVAPGAELPAGWLDRLGEATRNGAPVATASALTPILLGVDATPGAARAVAGSSLRLRPRLRAPGGPCVLIRREAIDLAGPLDGGFAERCLSAGLAHVLADDLLVAGAGGGGPPDGFLPPAPVLDPTPAVGPLRRALVATRRTLRPLAVTIDARELRGATTGTHVAALELIGALALRRELRLQVLLAPDAAEAARQVLARLEPLELHDAAGDIARADVVHRPFQVSTPADLAVLAALGDRTVVTQHDLIGYHNPAYFRDEEAWLGYREITRSALAFADCAVFVSEHGRRDALAEDLLEPHRALVVHNGVDHRLAAEESPGAPAGLGPGDGPFMLCLGTDLRHKNRLFALRLLAELRERHGWTGRLVLAGPSVALAATHMDEQRFLEARPAISPAVTDLGPVSEAEKGWLLEHAALVVYPSVVEGFGLIPFEAAERGTPCLWAAGSSLSELLPEDVAAIVPWDPAATAPRALALMQDGGERAGQLRAIGARAAELTWAAAAEALVEVYRRTAAQPASPAGARERASGLMRAGLSEDALRLVGPGGAIPPEVERPLLALATRPRLAQPVFAFLRAAYDASRHRDRRRS